MTGLSQIFGRGFSFRMRQFHQPKSSFTGHSCAEVASISENIRQIQNLWE
jgi:hypothetical protein